MNRILAPVLLAVLAGFSAQAAAIDYLLDFSGNICATASGACAENSPIGDSYGDVPGVVNVSYSRFVGAGIDQRLLWSGTNYKDLTGVAYGGTDDSAGTAEIFLEPAPGQALTLASFQLGATTQRATFIRILDGSRDVLASGGSLGTEASKIGISGVTASTFNFSLTSDEGIRIQWGPSAYRVGIDNIQFSVTPIPEPGTWALMGAGLALLGFAGRRPIAV